MTVNGNGINFWIDRNILKLVMAIKLCEYAKNHRMVQFKWMRCESDLNKAILYICIHTHTYIHYIYKQYI